MNSPFTSILFAVGLAVASQTAEAQPVVLPVKLADGTDTTLKLYLTLPSSPVLTETQTDGTHHDHFNVASSHSYVAWSLGEGGYTAEDFVPSAQVDTYLSPSGASSLKLTWSFWEGCHGGCTLATDLQFLMTSPNASLFSEPITDATFNGYAKLTGQIQIIYTDFVPPNNSYVNVTRFSATAVPEPTPALLALAGWIATARLAGRDRRRGKQTAPI
ncbi:MAG: hypothetical protein ACM3VZ_12960 [Acidobacteriota bacterium]